MPGWPSNRGPASRRRRRYNVRRVKATWPYTVREIAELFGIHENTVLSWLKHGLSADLREKPYLIRGDELARFLRQRQDGNRRKCRPDEFYCFRCREPREACLGMADIVIESPTRLRIKALCAVCETPVNKVQNARDFAKVRERFHIQQLAGEHLLERSGPSVNSDFRGMT